MVKEKNYYEELIEKLENLIKDNKNTEVLKILNEELSLPYVPKEYEEKFHQLLLEVLPEKQTKKSFFSRDELITLINEHKKYDVSFLLDISNGFNEYNWIGYEKQIQDIFDLKNLDNKIKCSIYNSLVIQNIDYDFLINNIKLNPFKNKTIFETNFAIKNLMNLDKKDLKDKTINSICEKIFFIYLMNEFPKCMNFEYKDISGELISIAEVMIGNRNIEELNESEKKLYLDINKK